MIRLVNSTGEKLFLRLFLLAGIFLWGVFSVYGQTPESLRRISADEAVDLAIRNNLMLEQARIGTDIRRRRSDMVWNQFLPSVNVTGTLVRPNFETVSPGMSFPLPPPIGPIEIPSTSYSPTWNMNVGLSMTLDFSFALIEGVRSAQLDYQAGLITLDKARLQMEQNVRKMYNSILLLEENARLLSETFNNTIRQAAIAEANFRAGLAPRLTWLQAQVAVENMRPSMNDLDNNLKNLKGNFALIMGLPHDAVFELEPVSYQSSFISADLSEFISRSVMGKPDIMELQASIMALQSQRKALSLSQHTPFLRLGFNLSSMLSDPFNTNWFDGNNWNYQGQAGGSFSITLGMNMNGLLGFTREGQQLRDMDDNIQIQNLRLSQMIRETEMEIFNKLNSLESIRTSVEAQQAAVTLAEMTYNSTEEAYRAGLQDFQAVQNSALALAQARLNLLTQNFNFLNDLIDLEYALGLPFGTLSNR